MPKGTNSMRIFCRVVLWWALLLPISAFAQGTNQTIFTNTTSASVGATNAIFVLGKHAHWAANDSHQRSWTMHFGTTALSNL